MVDSYSLKRLILESSYEEMRELLQNFVNEPNLDVCGTLIECLREVDSHKKRNKIALTLADLKCSCAVESLIELAKSPKTFGNKGTLLYALEEMEYTEFIEDIVGFLDAEHFEVRAQSYILLERAIVNLSEDKKRKCYEKITKKLEENYERLTFLEDAAELVKR